MMRFTKKPGELAIANDEPAVFIGVPDVVYLPNDVTFGDDAGKEVRVIRAFSVTYPGKITCRHLELDYQVSGKTLYVAETEAGYQWYTKK